MNVVLRITYTQKLRLPILESVKQPIFVLHIYCETITRFLEQNNKQRGDSYQLRAMNQSVTLHKRHDCWEKEHSSIDKHVDSSFHVIRVYSYRLSCL